VADSDIRLVPGQVRVEAWDLVLDAKDRRKTTTPQRRAMVHDFDDGLTVNWANDYPYGVTLKGVRTLEGKNLGPITKTEFKHAIDFRGALDVFNKLRFVASPVRWTQVIIDKANRLVIEAKGLPKPAEIVFKSPVVTHRVGQNGPLEILLSAKPNGTISRPPAKISVDEFLSSAGASHEQLLLSIAGQTESTVLVKVDAVDAIATLSDQVRKLRAQVLALEGTLAAAQTGWRRCVKCQTLVYPGTAATEKHPCPGGGKHSPDTTSPYRLLA
jgi:hypothetical protein